MAWIEERGGRYLVRWRQKGQKDGRAFDDPIEAKTFLEHVERRLAAGDTPILPTGLGEYAEWAIRMLEGVRESTRAAYLSYVRSHIAPWFGRDLGFCKKSEGPFTSKEHLIPIPTSSWTSD